MELLRSFLLAGTVQGFFLIFLIGSKIKRTISDRILMYWMAIIAFQLLFYYDNLAAKPLSPVWLGLIAFSLPLISSPILYSYIRSLAFSQIIGWRRSWIHSVPFLAFNCICLSAFVLQPGGMEIRKGLPIFTNVLPSPIIYLLTSLMAIVPGYYALLSLLVLIRYQRSLGDSYSFTEKVNLNWLKWIVISLFILFIGLFLLIRYGMHYGLVRKENLFVIVGTALSAYVFLIGYFGLRQTIIFPELSRPQGLESPTARYKNSGLNEELSLQLFQRLKRHMEQQQPFLDENLSLGILASQMDCSANQLSQVINQHSQGNFFTFINTYRVGLLKQRLKDPAFSHYSILGIGYDCGFQSKSSLNKIFKQITGQTPSEYQKS